VGQAVTVDFKVLSQNLTQTKEK